MTFAFAKCELTLTFLTGFNVTFDTLRHVNPLTSLQLKPPNVFAFAFAQCERSLQTSRPVLADSVSEVLFHDHSARFACYFICLHVVTFSSLRIGFLSQTDWHWTRLYHYVLYNRDKSFIQSYVMRVSTLSWVLVLIVCTDRRWTHPINLKSNYEYYRSSNWIYTYTRIARRSAGVALERWIWEICRIQAKDYFVQATKHTIKGSTWALMTSGANITNSGYQVPPPPKRMEVHHFVS